MIPFVDIVDGARHGPLFNGDQEVLRSLPARSKEDKIVAVPLIHIHVRGRESEVNARAISIIASDIRS